MITFRRAAALAAIALAATTTGAVAHEPGGNCSYTSVVTDGGWHDGLLTGYAYGGDEVTIRCYVIVDGTAVWSRPLAGGDSYTVEYVAFRASEWSTVRVCSEVYSSHGTVSRCRDS